MKIATTHLNIQWEEKEVNFEICRAIVDSYADENIDLIIFPEMTLTGFTMNSDYAAEDLNTSETIRKFCTLAKDTEVAIIFGVALMIEGKVTNNAILVSKSGEVIESYSKIHPFSLSDENKYYAPGSELRTADIMSLRIGFSICYDLRFPEIFRAYADSCDVVVNIANWPNSRIKHWNVLLQARALENQIYMIGVNRIGRDAYSIEYTRSSAVIDPNGDFLKPVFDNSEISIYNIDKEDIRKTRINFPVLKDRRKSLYARWAHVNSEEVNGHF